MEAIGEPRDDSPTYTEPGLSPQHNTSFPDRPSYRRRNGLAHYALQVVDPEEEEDIEQWLDDMQDSLNLTLLEYNELDQVSHPIGKLIRFDSLSCFRPVPYGSKAANFAENHAVKPANTTKAEKTQGLHAPVIDDPHKISRPPLTPVGRIPLVVRRRYDNIKISTTPVGPSARASSLRTSPLHAHQDFLYPENVSELFPTRMSPGRGDNL